MFPTPPKSPHQWTPDFLFAIWEGWWSLRFFFGKARKLTTIKHTVSARNLKCHYSILRTSLRWRQSLFSHWKGKELEESRNCLICWRSQSECNVDSSHSKCRQLCTCMSLSAFRKSRILPEEKKGGLDCSKLGQRRGWWAELKYIRNLVQTLRYKWYLTWIAVENWRQ